MSARIRRAPFGTFVSWPRERSSNTTTSHPSRRYASAMCEPIKPAPPVTSTRPVIPDMSASDSHRGLSWSMISQSAPQYRGGHFGRNRCWENGADHNTEVDQGDDRGPEPDRFRPITFTKLRWCYVRKEALPPAGRR